MTFHRFFVKCNATPHPGVFGNLMSVLGYLMGVLSYLMGVLGYLMGVPIKYPRTPIKYPKTPEAGGRHIGGVCGGGSPPT